MLRLQTNFILKQLSVQFMVKVRVRGLVKVMFCEQLERLNFNFHKLVSVDGLSK